VSELSWFAAQYAQMACISFCDKKKRRSAAGFPANRQILSLVKDGYAFFYQSGRITRPKYFHTRAEVQWPVCFHG
jgi:hypothetical protein